MFDADEMLLCRVRLGGDHAEPKLLDAAGGIEAHDDRIDHPLAVVQDGRLAIARQRMERDRRGDVGNDDPPHGIARRGNRRIAGGQAEVDQAHVLGLGRNDDLQQHPDGPIALGIGGDDGDGIGVGLERDGGRPLRGSGEDRILVAEAHGAEAGGIRDPSPHENVPRPGGQRPVAVGSDQLDRRPGLVLRRSHGARERDGVEPDVAVDETHDDSARLAFGHIDGLRERVAARGRGQVSVVDEDRVGALGNLEGKSRLRRSRRKALRHGQHHHRERGVADFDAEVLGPHGRRRVRHLAGRRRRPPGRKAPPIHAELPPFDAQGVALADDETAQSRDPGGPGEAAIDQRTLARRVGRRQRT